MTLNLSSVNTRALLGLESPPVTVEVHATNGLPSFSIVGLPETSVKESRDRVRSALISSNYILPPQRITVNLAPADLPKVGSRYDLSIALGILIATGQLQADITKYEFIGELGLDGKLRSVDGIIPTILSNKVLGRTVVIPTTNLNEASLLNGYNINVLGANNLLEICQHLCENSPLQQPEKLAYSATKYSVDISDIKGQSQAKRALEIAASGKHNLIMVGNPGSGKSMLANRLITILPELNQEQAIEVSAIHSIAGSVISNKNRLHRPFLSPHHTATPPAIVGGGSHLKPKPGAISLAHNGVLFLDELPEFNRSVLEALREPLENKNIQISRINGHINYPANFQLVAALNPTPSGFFADDAKGRCKDTPEQILRYLRKISGPLLDRIDIQIEVAPTEISTMQQQDKNMETSCIIRNRVTKCHNRQMERQGCLNSELSVKQLQKIRLTKETQNFLEMAINKLGLSVRAYHAILKTSLTIADMQQSNLTQENIAEAIGYRSLDRLKI